MIIIQTTDNKWYCTNSVNVARNIAGLENENLLNLWEQPFFESDFFWKFKDGQNLEGPIPMRKWEQDLPLSQCLKGNVQWVATTTKAKPPVWYRHYLTTDWVQFRTEERERALKANERIEEAKSRGDEEEALNEVIDFLLGK